MDRCDEPDLYAYVGEDEHGSSGEVGLKQARVPTGVIPIVVVDRDLHKIEDGTVREQLQRQAKLYGKQIRLVRYMPVEVVFTLDP